MRSLLACLGLLVLAVPSALAAPGDNYPDAKVGKGYWRVLWAQYVCDGHSGGAGDCVDLDLNAVGAPAVLVLEVVANTGCGVTSVVVETRGKTTGTLYDVDTSTVTLSGTNNRVVIDFTAAPTDRYVTFDGSASTTCTDLEVVAYGHAPAGGS